MKWTVFLSHSGEQDLHRCLGLSFGKQRLHLCTRCAGLYPALALALAYGLADPPLSSQASRVLGFWLPLVGTGLWVVEQWGLWLPRTLRLLAGAVLGLGLGWVLAGHLEEPWSVEVRSLLRQLVPLAALGLVGGLRRVIKDSEKITPPPNPLATDVQQKNSRKSPK